MCILCVAKEPQSLLGRFGSPVWNAVATMSTMVVYGLTIFTGAFLLFQVQPLIGKYILPWFGGAPSVWTTCMLFFQVMLLVGYAYAHVLSKLKPRWQAGVHLGLTVAAFWFLPAIPSEAWKPSGSENPTWRIIGLLGATIGLPYFVLAATSPLLQHWFNRTNAEKSPYRLYALSNAGSLLALASYPTFFEPHFTRLVQARTWAWGLVAYGLGLALCAWNLCAMRSRTRIQGTTSFPSAELQNTIPAPAPEAQTQRASFGSRTFFWVGLPACASALLLATTNKMCQEVAVVPFLWVVPLGLYLLSFIICFDSPRWYHRFVFGISLTGTMGAVCWALFHTYDISVPTQTFIYAATCFVCCMVCHGELYRLKPEPNHLTGFYLTIALGGALGGLFVGIISPLIFNDYFELQWGLGSCVLLFILLIWRDYHSGRLKSWGWKPPRLVSWGALAWLGLSLAWLAMISAFWVQSHQQGPMAVRKMRNFYGVLTVIERKEPVSGLLFAKLVHGRTAHGLQFRDPARASWPTMYYSQRSGVGLALQQLPPGPKRIGLVGLGTGTLATYAQAGDYLRVYEINPSVAQLARSHFSYLRNSRADTELVLGDARLSLEKEPSKGFDLLALDAFSSDAIPVHLLTEEAFWLYQRHLKTSGILAVHVSNQSLDLEPVVANLASRFGYTATIIDYQPPPEDWWLARSKWVLLSKGDAGLRLSRCCKDARSARTDLRRVPLWTDDFTSLFQILWRSSPRKAEPCTAALELQSALRFAQQGDVHGAVEHYRAALDSEPDLVVALNNLAWILATNPDEALRDGAEALKCARRACELTNFRTTIMVGTLAAAYAEVGRFGEAIAAGEEACHLASEAKDIVLLTKNQQLLEVYRSNKPARE